MANAELVRLFPQKKEGDETSDTNKWIGRIAIFELITKSRVQGRILNVSPEWIDTDNGAVRVRYIVSAKWVSAEEAAIIRGGPLLSGTQTPRQIR
jgi:hypothetical protein